MRPWALKVTGSKSVPGLWSCWCWGYKWPGREANWQGGGGEGRGRDGSISDPARVEAPLTGQGTEEEGLGQPSGSVCRGPAHRPGRAAVRQGAQVGAVMCRRRLAPSQPRPVSPTWSPRPCWGLPCWTGGKGPGEAGGHRLGHCEEP